MTHADAVTLLDVPDPSSFEAIEAAFHRERMRVEQRLASADAPALKTQYLQLAARLREAHEFLVAETRRTSIAAGDGPHTRLDDLPLLQPLGTAANTEERHHEFRTIAGDDRRQLEPGRMLADRFEIVRKLGDGSRGTVYAAHDRVRGAQVAIRMLPSEIVGQRRHFEQLLAEVRLAAELNHPHIASVGDVQQIPGNAFIVMELLEGGHTLRAEIERRTKRAQRFTLDEVWRLAGQAGDALQTLHRRLVHGHVKPENLWLGADGNLKLIDHGTNLLGRSGAPDAPPTPDDRLDDQRALAAVVYELLTDNVPSANPPPPHHVRKSLSPRLSAVVAKALDGDPRNRFSDVGRFIQALRSATATPRQAAWSPVAGLAALVVVAVAILFATTWRPSSGVSKADYARRLAEANALRERIDQLDKDLAAEARTAQADVDKWQRELVSAEDGKHAVQRDYAQARLEQARPALELVLQRHEAWTRHHRRAEWLSEAAGETSAAEALATDGSYAQAIERLDVADERMKALADWHERAREVLASTRRLRGELNERLTRLDPLERIFFETPKNRLDGAVERLRDDDGRQPLADVRQVAAVLPQIDKLLALRSEAASAAGWNEAALQIEEFRNQHATLDGQRRAADEHLRLGRLAPAESALKAAIQGYQELPTKIMDSLLSEARKLAGVDQPQALLPLTTALLRTTWDHADLGSRTAELYSLRGMAQFKQGYYQEAADDCSAALKLDGHYTEAFRQRGLARYELADYSAALSDFDEALRLDDADAVSRMVRALLRATCPETARRDGQRAFADAQQAYELTAGKDAGVLATLAAAYAECGDFAGAVKWQAKSLDLNGAATEFEQEARRRLKLYERGRPLRLRSPASRPGTDGFLE